MSRFIKSAALIAALALATAPAALAHRQVTNSVNVSYADLDLSAQAGAERLLQRIKVASKRVCGPRPTSVFSGQLRRYNACRETAISAAVDRVNHPTVSTIWAGEPRRTITVALR